jgi:multidrug efflux pump subunit AcrA (membrane-fusion protein)
MKNWVHNLPPQSSDSKVSSLLVLLLLVISSAACKSGYQASAKQGGNAPAAREVKLLKVEEKPMENLISVTGTLAAYDEATISSKINGRIRAINVDLGSPVRAGQVIAELESKDAQLRLQQAEAALAQARARLGLSPTASDERVDIEETSTVRQARAVLDEAKLKVERMTSLVQQGVIAKSQLDAVEAEYKVALGRYQDAQEEIRNRQAVLLQRRSEVDIARQQIVDTTIKAAFDGIIQEKRASIGEYVASGAPIVTVVKMNPLRLRAEVPERESRDVKQGQSVRVSVEGDSNIYSGIIKRISPAITAQNRVLMVEAEVQNNGQLKPGAFAKADIVVNANSLTVAVPSSAVVSFAGIDKVLTVQEGKAAEKPVTMGRRNGDWIEILSGIKVGDSVIVDPGNLQTGQPVNIIQ